MFASGAALTIIYVSATSSMTIGHDEGTYDPRSTYHYGGNRAPSDMPALPSVRDFMDAARDITPRALAVPPTHLPIAGELRFVIEIVSDARPDRAARARPWVVRALGAPRERRPLRSRPGFRHVQAG